MKLPEIARIKHTMFGGSVLIYNTFPNFGYVDIFSDETLLYTVFIAPKDVVEVSNTELFKYLEKDYTMRLTDIDTKEVKTYEIKY